MFFHEEMIFLFEICISFFIFSNIFFLHIFLCKIKSMLFTNNIITYYIFYFLLLFVQMFNLNKFIFYVV